MKEVTLVFENGGYVVVRINEFDYTNLFDLVNSFGMPCDIRDTVWVDDNGSQIELT